MNEKTAQAIHFMTQTDSTATVAQCRAYLESQIQFLGEEEAIKKVYRKGRYFQLLEPVKKALGSKLAISEWNEEDEGFRTVREGIDVVVWIQERIRNGATDEEIINEAKNA